MLRLRFKLNHLVQGQNAPFLLAQDEGFFAQAGVEARFVEGFSSAQVTRALVDGEAEFGFGDATSVLEAALRANATPLACLLPIHVRSPCSLGYRRGNGTLRLADLDGAVLCGPKGDASARLLPLLLAANGLGHVRYEMRVVSPEERDRLVANNEVRAATCFDATLKFAMRMRGYDDSDLAFLAFADHGLDAYAGALVVQDAVLQAHRELAAGLAAATRAAWEASRAHPDAAVAAVLRRNPALDAAIVRAQLEWVLAHNVFPGTQLPFEFRHGSPRMDATLMAARTAVDGAATVTPAMRQIAFAVCRGPQSALSSPPDSSPTGA
ncbi:MAG: ABC transporter substrate-binding protein [Telmatospirillum sp.]|nr:ABC transporter substrate-binding protein [Telmatospirillum sp.]